MQALVLAVVAVFRLVRVEIAAANLPGDRRAEACPDAEVEVLPSRLCHHRAKQDGAGETIG